MAAWRARGGGRYQNGEGGGRGVAKAQWRGREGRVDAREATLPSQPFKRPVHQKGPKRRFITQGDVRKRRRR